MAWISRFVAEDAHFEEVPGCPLRGARTGHATATDVESERACARCRYNVCAPGEPRIGCSVRTPHIVVEAARARARLKDPSLIDDLQALRSGADVVTAVTVPPWQRLGERWLAVARTADRELGHDVAGLELASVILRFAAAAAIDDVEILR
jgi:hypothetical protein